MAATGKVIGTVTAVVGEAKATAADGTVRILQVGDTVHSDESITTSAAGSINVALANGKTLDCGADTDLTLNEGILHVATANDSAKSAVASDIEAIQRVIVAGQDPSQIAPATAAGGAPAAGGAEEGGAHAPVVLEQGNSASVVSSGFSTEGDSIAFPTQVPAALPGLVVASNSAPVFSNADDHASTPVAPVEPVQPAAPAASLPSVVTNEPAPQADAGSQNQPEAPVTADAPVVVADTGSNAPAEEPQAPVAQNQPTEPTHEEPSAPVEQPVIVASNDDQPSQPTNEQPSTPAEEPVIVATNDPQPGDQPQTPLEPSNEPSTPVEQPVIVATNDPQPGDQPQSPVVTDTNDNTPPVTPTDEPSPSATVSLDYTISANTNQDEQLGKLIFQNGDNTFETLVFFGQEGQQKPTAVTLQFDLSEGTSTVKLQYVDTFAGNSDQGTGHTAQQIAIKDFGLGIDGTPTVLAQQNDGVNIGVGNKNLMSEGSVNIDMNTHEAGSWSFANQTGSNGVDILDFTGNSLNLASVSGHEDVINLKGSAAQEMTLSAADVLNVSDGSNVLHIVGGKEDSLNLDSSWTVHDGDAAAAGTQASYFGWVSVTHDSGATLLVDPDVQIKGASMG
jgi:hypothetical protein